MRDFFQKIWIAALSMIWAAWAIARASKREIKSILFDLVVAACIVVPFSLVIIQWASEDWAIPCEHQQQGYCHG
jgi:hypothetical protein